MCAEQKIGMLYAAGQAYVLQRSVTSYNVVQRLTT